MDTRIGFRIKLKKFNYDELEQFIKQYAVLFKRYEIKVTDDIINEENITNIIQLSYKYLRNNFSLHLPKRMLKDEMELKKCIVLFKLLQDVHYEGNLVTHISNDFDLEGYRNFLVTISNVIPVNCTLLLENTIVENIEYLNKIDKLLYILNINNVENIKFCLDIGHLFFGCCKMGIEQDKILEELKKYKNILFNIKEIHLHDFNDRTDHLNIGKGMLDLIKITNFIAKNKIKCPVIIESTIENSNSDGRDQIKIVSQILLEKKEE